MLKQMKQIQQNSNTKSNDEDGKKLKEVLLVKDTEIESLKKKLKEAREQVPESKSSKDQKRQEDMMKSDLQVKDMMINQLKKDNEKMAQE